MSLNDIRTLTSIELEKDSYTENEINLLIKDLYKSDLIFDVVYTYDDKFHVLDIQENKLIENIYLNGNDRIDDELIIQNISLKKMDF